MTCGAADDELADDAGRDARAVIVNDVGLGVRNGDADRARSAIESSDGGSQVQRLHSVSPYIE